jgi:Large polyvalent protein associated domain 38
MPYDIRLPDGTLVNNIPDELDPVAAKAKILQAYPDLALEEKRTFGEAATDIAASFGKGLGTLAQIPGQVYGLATGDVQPNEGLQGLGKKFEAYSESFKSPVLKAKEAHRQQKINEAEGFFNEAGTAIGETIKDPALLASFFGEQIPNLIGAGGTGIITKTGAKLLFRDATEAALAKAGTYGARAGEAAMQGADIGSDTYEKIYDARIKQGATEEEAKKDALLGGRKAAIEAGAITFGTSFGAGSTIEQALTRGAAGATKHGIIRGTLGELASEAAEEGGGQLVSNLQLQNVVPETDVMKGVGAAAGLGAIGGALFGLPASFVNKANAAELELAKKMVEDAKKRAAENNQPEEVQLQLGFDPNVKGSGIYTPIIVNPDGTTTFPSERNQFAQVVPNELSEAGMAEKYGIPTPEQLKERTFDADTIKSFGISPKANIYKNTGVLGADIADPAQAAKVKAELEAYLKKYPKANPKIRQNIMNYLARPEFQPRPVAPTQVTEASITPQADQAAARQRLIDGFKNRPEIKKIYEEYDKQMAAKDADKAALSAFNNIVTPETLKSLGFHPAAGIYQDPEVLNADLTNPDTADQIRAKLMAVQSQTKSKSIKDNIEKYLNRSEFITPRFVEDYLNPPRTENEQGLDHFVFTDAEGNIQSKYGTIYEKNGKKYVKYPENKGQKGGERELTENVAVNPNPDQIELISLYKAKENLMKEPDDFKQWLMSYGVNSKERSDMGLETRVPHRMFRDDGWGLDDLVLASINDGILTEGDFDMNTTNGGVEQMKEYIKRALYGEFVPTLNNTRNMMDLEHLQSRIDQLENKVKGVPEEDIAEQLKTEEPAKENPVAEEKAIEEQAPKKKLTAKDVLEGMPAQELAAKNQSREGLTLDQLEVLDLADKIETAGEAGFANSMRQNVLRKNPLTLQNMDFYRSRAKEFLSRAGAEKSPINENLDINAFVEGFEKDKARLRDQTDFFGTKTSKTVAKSNDYIKRLAQVINDAGYKVSEINSGAPKYLQELKTKISQIAGSTTRLMKEQEALDKGYKRADIEKHSKTLKTLEQDFKEADALLNETTQGKQEISQTPYADQFIKDSKKLAKDIRLALNKMGLRDVGLKFEDALQRRIDGNMTRINGEYFDKMIELSLSGDNIFRTMNHESLHAMKDLGFFSDKEWKTLENKARSVWMEKYDIAKSYSNESEEVQLEEAIAHAFADMQTQPAPIKSMMSRAVNFLKRIGNWLRGNGYTTAEDIFKKAAEGKLSSTKEGIRAKVPKQERMKASFEGVDEAYAQAIKKQFAQEEATVGEKFENLKDNFFEKMVTGLFDEFRAIKKYSTEGYMMARLSKSIDGGLQGLLEHGQVYINDGALDIRPGTKGLLEILAPLGKEVDQYQIWKALNRDAQMPADKRSFDPALIAGRDKLAQGTIDGKSRKEVYEKARDEENKLNKSVLDVALESGLIDKQAYQVFSNDINYIPFYKVMEDGDVNSVNASSKLTGQYFSKALKGGEKKTNDLMENVLLNWSHILSASMKNQAAFKTVQAAESMGAAVKAKPMDGKYPPNTIKVMEGGKTTHYTLEDPDLVDAISTISYLGPKSAFLNIAKGFTNALRYGVTLSPAYKVRNLIRDSLQSAAISELGPNMFENVYNGLKMTKKGDPTFMSALAGGGIFEMGTAHEGDQAKLIKRLIDKGVKEATILDTPEKIKGKLQDLLDSYNELGNKFENANRLALYKKLRDSGKSHLEASYAARDLMDFSMQGQFRAVKVIGSCVPFFNARLQGLYKLGRDGLSPTYRVICNATTGKPLQIGDKEKATRFATMASAIALASLALYGMYKDDEDFQRREDWDRDNFWWFKIGETQFRIPKPFEIGAIGTVAERTYEQIVDENVEGKVFGQRMNAILMDTFSINPVPQMMKPLIDLYANKDSFTGAPIESAGMERLSKQERVNDKTSGIAIALGGISVGAQKILTFNPDAEGISPVQMDYAIKAYLGWLGATVVSTADRAVEPFQEGTKVHPPIIDQVALGFIKTEPQTQSKYMTQFYQNNARLQSALADMRHYAELGEMDKVTQIMEEKGNQIALSKIYDKTTKQLAELRKQSRRIEHDKDMNADDKRAEMNRLKILMSDMAREMEQIRKTQ